MTALSVHAYAYLSDRYRLLPHGASMGERYGPIVVAREDLDPGALPGLRVAVPGRLTSAFLQLQLAVGRVEEPLITPFDRILDVVAAGGADAGLVIHEAQSIPEPGQAFTFYGYRFEILRKNRNKITAIRVRPVAAKQRRPRTNLESDAMDAG